MAASAAADAGPSTHARGAAPRTPPRADSGEALEAALAQLGPFGLYHQYLLVLLCLPHVLAVMYSHNYVFVADQVPFRCVVPECEGEAAQYGDVAAAALLPAAACRRYAPLAGATHGACLREHYHPNETIPCETFVYETQDTLFAEFDLGCRERPRALAGSVRSSALPVALLLTGYVSDKFGRRTAFCACSLLAGALGLAKACALNYYMFLTLEWFQAALGYGFSGAAYVMMVEIAPPALRGVFASATGAACGAGGVVFAWLARAVPRWRSLLACAHAPALLLPAYRLLLGESPRWLHATGDLRGTEAYIRRAARWNKITVDEELMKRLKEGTRKAEAEPQGSRWLELAGSRVLAARLALLGWCWAAAALAHYGLAVRSAALSADKYADFALSMAMEVAAALLAMMALQRLGRPLCVCLAFLLCGFACVLPFFIVHAGTSLALVFAGRLAAVVAVTALHVLSAELFPTRARSSALAACSLLGCAGSALAPQTPLLSAQAQAGLYGASGALAALAALLVADTRRAHLPQHRADAERLPPAAPPQHQPAPAPHRRVLSADT